MIVYGSRMYGVRNVVLSHGECEKCGHYGELKSYDGRRWGHIYFIPLIPEGKPVRILKECKKCNSASSIPLADLDKVLTATRESVEHCLQAVEAGKNHFQLPGQAEKLPTGHFLRSHVESLFILSAAADIEVLYQRLEAAGAGHELLMAQSMHCELCGELNDSATFLEQAVDESDDPAVTLYLLARIYQSAGRHAEVVSTCEKCLNLAGDDLSVYLLMADSLDALQDYPRQNEILQKCVQLAPDLQTNKKFMKLVNKSRKKAEKAAR
ncbi:MAG: hypothetical protein HJJLKODD_02062 [Phycisphaerae bacterium]|nr:hypothetical protein [Phycisphaerae bacterium]